MELGIRAIAGMTVVLSVLAAPAVAELPKYQMKDLGTLSGTSSYGLHINSAGHVAGVSFSTGNAGPRVFLWDGTSLKDLGPGYIYVDEGRGPAINDTDVVTGSSPGVSNGRAVVWNGTGMVDLGAPTGVYSEGRAINKSGNVAGEYGARAFYWDGTSTLDIGTLGGSTSTVHGINDAGQVTGASKLPNETWHGYVWDGTRMIDIGSLSSGTSVGFAINDAGDVAGFSEAPDGKTHAVLWNGTELRDLGTLGNSAWSYAINNSGHVTGYGQTSSGSTHAFLWDGSSMRDLGTLGGPNSSGNSINNLGHVTGESSLAEGESHAFVWDGYRMLDLGMLAGAYSSVGRDINDAGQVAGYSGGHAVLWTPISLLFSKLLTDSSGVGPDRKLAKVVTLAQSYYQADDLESTCSYLSDFNDQDQKLPTKKTAQSVRDDLIGQSQAIMVAVGCP